MQAYRIKPTVVYAAQWFKNGDHPDDRVGEKLTEPTVGEYERVEGAVVRYFRNPPPLFRGDTKHDFCGHRWHVHGWIDEGDGGLVVCPGDWIITNSNGTHYAMHAGAFAKLYEPVDEQPNDSLPGTVRQPINCTVSSHPHDVVYKYVEGGLCYFTHEESRAEAVAWAVDQIGKNGHLFEWMKVVNYMEHPPGKLPENLVARASRHCWIWTPQ